MSAKTRKDSILFVYEGYQEGYFLEYLENLRKGKVRLNTYFCSGGSANEIIISGIIHSARDVKVYVFFDEDFQSKSGYEISEEALEGLEKAWKLNGTLKGCSYRDLQEMNKEHRNPNLIVSNPQSIEGLLLRLLGISLQDLEGKTTQQLKGTIANYLSNVSLNNEDNEKINNYDKKILKFNVEITRLQLSEPLNKKRRLFFEEKIRECGRNKNKVAFMRFLSDKLPLSVIVAKRVDIPEVDILLKAFGL